MIVLIKRYDKSEPPETDSQFANFIEFLVLYLQVGLQFLHMVDELREIGSK
jgi:hypothetical protein